MLRSRGSRGEGQINRNLAESLKSREIIIQPQILEDTQIEEDYSVGLTSWEGGKWKFGRLTSLAPSAPPLSRQMKILAGTSEPQRGRALGL